MYIYIYIYDTNLIAENEVTSDILANVGGKEEANS